jgi:hypothetical protein
MFDNPILYRKICHGFWFVDWEFGNFKSFQGISFRAFLLLHKNAELLLFTLILKLTIQNITSSACK